MAVVASPLLKSLATVVRQLGDVPLERIGLPVGSATEQDVLDALESADKRLFELIDGVLVEKPMGFKESYYGSEIGRHLGNYLEDHDRGLSFGADAPFRLRHGRIRFPDTGFISWERLSDRVIPDEPILDAIPDLAVEVVSEGNTPAEMQLKLRDFFEAGVRLVWLIHPKTHTAEVYTSAKRRRLLSADGVLDGGDVLPGFVLPLKKLFARAPRRRNGKKSDGR